MNRSKNRGMYFIFFLVAVAFILSGTLPIFAGTGKNVTLRPIIQTYSGQTSSGASHESDDPEVRAFAEKFKSTLKSLKAESRKKKPANTPEKRNVTSANHPFWKRADVKIRYRKNGGTPNLVQGKALAAAVSGMVPGKERNEQTALNFLRSGRKILKIDDTDREFVLNRYETDDTNRTHIRFSQQFRGIPVWPSELRVHLSPEGNVYMMDGAFVSTPKKVPYRPVISPEKAIDLAVMAVPDTTPDHAGKPEKIIYAAPDGVTRPAWKIPFDISVTQQWIVVIDSQNGNMLTAFNTVTDAGVVGSGADLDGITRAIDVWEENGYYYMVNTAKPMYNASASNPPTAGSVYGGIVIMDARNKPETSNVEYIPKTRNVSSASANSGWLPDAVSAAYSLSETYDYYYTRHNRNSIDGSGGTIIAVVRIGQNYENAFWNSETKTMYFGDGLDFAKAIDVVAHELTHGVTTYSANLVYQYQSGALNEAFSDIFGEMAEARTNGSPDWVMGASIAPPLRSLSDPGSLTYLPGKYYPADMSEYVNTSQDNGGVHINNTIIGRAFYLLAEGLSGAVGITDAEKIFYRALVYHLVSGSQFIDARIACIASAGELFGSGSAQAQKVAEAFDTVGIFDDTGTSTGPVEVPPVTGDDALMFVYFDSSRNDYYLGRREADDPDLGVVASCYGVTDTAHPSISGNGETGVFVNSRNDICLFDTNLSECETCLGFSGFVHSVAMSPDGNLFGFIFLDASGQPTDSISVINLKTDSPKTYDLVAPTFDEGVTMNSIETADAMDFTMDGRYLVYDAYNRIEFEDNTALGAWSIYAIDLSTDQTIVVVPPVSGLDIGYPSLGNTSDDIIVFDAHDIQTGQSVIWAGNMVTGDLASIDSVQSNWAIPVYNGNDSAVVYTDVSSNATTGFSLWSRPVSQDHISTTGSATLYMYDAFFGTVYRRGTFTAPAGNISVSPSTASFGSQNVGTSSLLVVQVSNTGSDDLIITDMYLSGTDVSQFRAEGGCDGQTVSPGSTCSIRLYFEPLTSGSKSGTLTIKSDDPDQPTVTISLFGSGLSTSSGDTSDSDSGGGGGGGCFIDTAGTFGYFGR